MSKDQIIIYLVSRNVELEQEIRNLKAHSIPVATEYRIGDLAAILKNITEGNP